MAFKTFLVVSLVIAAILAAPVAEAQLGLIGGLLGLIRIQGTLFCTADGNMGANGTATPVFPSMLALISLPFLLPSIIIILCSSSYLAYKVVITLTGFFL